MLVPPSLVTLSLSRRSLPSLSLSLSPWLSPLPLPALSTAATVPRSVPTLALQVRIYLAQLIGLSARSPVLLLLLLVVASM